VRAVWRSLDQAERAREWREATPFPHLVIDDAIANPDELLVLLEEEAVHRYEAELFVFEASAPEPRSAELRATRAAFTEAFAAPLSAITGKLVTRVDMRAFAYRPGHYLLPHTDRDGGLDRRLAYAYYLPSPDEPAGGELELFACEIADGELTATTSAKLYEPRPNRLIVFDVSDVSLHQVREVLAGLRISLAGWFYP
jgi:Rps23 Pro-64 3,4-dihydroxylase Tpa1-like proline 4-hydroxylase